MVSVPFAAEHNVRFRDGGSVAGAIPAASFTAITTACYAATPAVRSCSRSHAPAWEQVTLLIAELFVHTFKLTHLFYKF